MIKITIVIISAKPMFVNRLAIIICEIIRLEEIEKGITRIEAEFTTEI